MINRLLILVLVFLSKIFRLFQSENKILFESKPFNTDSSSIIYREMTKSLGGNYNFYWFIDTSDNPKGDEGYKKIVINRNGLVNRIISETITLFHISTCSMYIFSNVCYARVSPNKNQKFINLTHGQSLKNTSGAYQSTELMSYIITLSDFSMILREKSFKGGKNKMLNLGFPRNDLLFLKTDLAIFQKNFILWLPTFRRQKNTGRNDTGTNENTDLPILKNENLIFELNKFLIELDFYIYVKSHPAQDMNFFKNVELTNFKIIDDNYLKQEEIHLYELLSQSKSLLTDYSSVYIDYLLTENMIGFTVDDFNEFRDNKGFLVDNPEEFMPGHKISDIVTLKEYIKDVANGNDLYKQDRDRVKNLFHINQDSSSTKRVMELIMKILKGEKYNV